MSQPESAFVLGTAMWGWTIPEKDCHRIMDAYYEQGGRWLDGATNYPINKQAGDFRKAEKILLDWIKSRGVDDLKLIMKVGSVNNLGGPENNLNPSFLLLCAQEYQHLFGSQLRSLMIHWDNRVEEPEIEASLQTLAAIPGLEIGLSGIKHPESYAKVLEQLNCREFWLQLKHNVVYSDYNRYNPLHPQAKCIAYGINAGGLKLDTAAYSKQASLMARGGNPGQYQKLVADLVLLVEKFSGNEERPALKKMNHIGLLYALAHPGIERVLLGVSRIEQLKDSLAWEAHFQQFDYADWYVALAEVVVKHTKK